VIREQDESHPDLEGLRAKALSACKHKQHITSLHNSSQEHGQAGEWDAALRDLVQLQKEEPGYPGIETLLTTARYMARLSGILARARENLDTEAYAASVDELDELSRIDRQYRHEEVTAL
jgi:hypothetical protein